MPRRHGVPCGVVDPRRGVTSVTVVLAVAGLTMIAALLEGRRVHAEYCASCHGVSGVGAPGPAFVAGRLLKVLPDPADEHALLRKGGAVMPSFADTLGGAHLDAVARYTREVLAPRRGGSG
jgi:mono/diheme cytochrome c family protein